MNIAARPGSGFDWALMRSFLAVVEEGSLLAAARRLGSSQPTIGRHVAELEEQLGVALFERTGRGLVPTRTALAIADDARAMAASADAIARALAGQRQATTGTVRVTASQLIAFGVLPPIVAKLREREPGIAIEVVSSNALANLLRREADIAVRMVRPTQSSLITRRVAELGIGFYAHRDYVRRRGLPTTPGDLLHHDLIGFDTDDLLIRGYARMGVAIERERFAFRTDDHVVCWQALRAGLGIGFAPIHMADNDPDLARVLADVAVRPFPMWLTVHREIRGSARIRAVYDFLAQALPDALRT